MMGLHKVRNKMNIAGFCCCCPPTTLKKIVKRRYYYSCYLYVEACFGTGFDKHYTKLTSLSFCFLYRHLPEKTNNLLERPQRQ